MPAGEEFLPAKHSERHKHSCDRINIWDQGGGRRILLPAREFFFYYAMWMLEREAAAGIRGIRYDGRRRDVPVQVVVAVCREDA